MAIIQNIEVKNFTAFSKLRLEFSDGINVFIGGNATGKTHILKLIYLLTNSILQIGDSQIATDEAHPASLQDYFLASPKDLIRQPFDKNSSGFIKLNTEQQNQIGLSWSGLSTLLGKPVSVTTNNITFASSRYFKQLINIIFLPAREVMSIFPGFISAYQKRELAFDKTYYDLCLALDASPLRQPLFKHEAYILEPLYEIIHGKVYREGRGFYVDLPDAKKLDANIVAEGLRKIATLIYLVKNGSIAPNSILLLDEPEANLNPKLVPKMLEFLRRLTGEGVQIFLATHDYLVAHELSLHAEYVEDDTSRFFSFYRQENGDGVAVEVGDTLVDIDHNPILDEYAAHHERETALFYKHAPQTETA